MLHVLVPLQQIDVNEFGGNNEFLDELDVVLAREGGRLSGGDLLRVICYN